MNGCYSVSYGHAAFKPAASLHLSPCYRAMALVSDWKETTEDCSHYLVFKKIAEKMTKLIQPKIEVILIYF